VIIRRLARPTLEPPQLNSRSDWAAAMKLSASLPLTAGVANATVAA